MLNAIRRPTRSKSSAPKEVRTQKSKPSRAAQDADTLQASPTRVQTASDHAGQPPSSAGLQAPAKSGSGTAASSPAQPSGELGQLPTELLHVIAAPLGPKDLYNLTLSHKTLDTQLRQVLFQRWKAAFAAIKLPLPPVSGHSLVPLAQAYRAGCRAQVARFVAARKRQPFRRSPVNPTRQVQELAQLLTTRGEWVTELNLTDFDGATVPHLIDVFCLCPNIKTFALPDLVCELDLPGAVEALKNLPHLTHLAVTLWDRSLTAAEVAQELPNLLGLRVCTKKLNEVLLAWPKLTHLDLSDIHFHQVLPKGLAQHKCLQYLTLHASLFSNLEVLEKSPVEQLRLIDTPKQPLSGEQLSKLAKFRNLKVIDVTATHLDVSTLPAPLKRQIATGRILSLAPLDNKR